VTERPAPAAAGAWRLGACAGGAWAAGAWAASHALATVIPDDELGPEYVIPGVFNRDVAPRVAAAVADAAERDGVARKPT